MPSRKSRVPVGPFPRGIYHTTDPASVPSGYILDGLNCYAEADGLIKQRPGIYAVSDTEDFFGPTNTTGTSVNVLGEFRYETDIVYDIVTEEQNVFFCKNAASDANKGVFYTSNGRTFTDTLLTAFTGNGFVTMQSYNGGLWMVPRYVTGGTPSVGRKLAITASAPSTWVVTSHIDMPAGNFALINKDRLFIANARTSRVYYSKATDPSIWAAPDGGFFDVNPNDGFNINAFFMRNDSIYIFKNSGIWIFDYTAIPGSDGQLRQVTTTGALDAVTFDNSIYLFNEDGVYRYVNNNLTEISNTLEWHLMVRYQRDQGSTVPPLTMFVVEGYLIIGPFVSINDDSPANSRYSVTHRVCNLKTGSWWNWNFHVGYMPTKGFIAYDTTDRETRYLSATGLVVVALYSFDSYKHNDRISSSDVKTPGFGIILPEIDFGIPDQWKRCYKVGIDYGKNRPGLPLEGTDLQITAYVNTSFPSGSVLGEFLTSELQYTGLDIYNDLNEKLEPMYLIIGTDFPSFRFKSLILRIGQDIIDHETNESDTVSGIYFNRITIYASMKADISV